jgi:hypothetical protein
MMSLDLPNDICSAPVGTQNPCKYAAFNDPMLVFMDSILPDGGEKDYKEIAKKLFELSSRSKNFARIYGSLACLCDFLSVKYDLGIRLRAAYKAGKKEELKDLIQVIEVAREKLDKFYYAFKEQWYEENKPHGFDVQDIRFGGLDRRLKNTKETITAYLDGKLSKIEELEETLIDFYDNENPKKKLTCYNLWGAMATSNTL